MDACSVICHKNFDKADDTGWDHPGTLTIILLRNTENVDRLDLLSWLTYHNTLWISTCVIVYLDEIDQNGTVSNIHEKYIVHIYIYPFRSRKGQFHKLRSTCTYTWPHVQIIYIYIYISYSVSGDSGEHWTNIPTDFPSPSFVFVVLGIIIIRLKLWM